VASCSSPARRSAVSTSASPAAIARPSRATPACARRRAQWQGCCAAVGERWRGTCAAALRTSATLRAEHSSMASSAASKSGGRGGERSARPAPRSSSGGGVAAICCKAPRMAGKLRALEVRQQVQGVTARGTYGAEPLHCSATGPSWTLKAQAHSSVVELCESCSYATLSSDPHPTFGRDCCICMLALQ